MGADARCYRRERDRLAAHQGEERALKTQDFSATFTCLQARKDLGLITGAAAAGGVRAPVAEIAARLIEDCIANGSEEEDYAAMIKAVERSAR